ncbi:hypothetical protein BXZ70DRAFT_568948 [Cristinia sonorae]|uniref:FAD-binding domain-containing protein n=1 Tax=Cristinia sonorae TaxID=1940300 RepID=A0A8K0UF69_9AGAR|nr:hypothetical protein BXZ70DRAFT_568948 [Cristinia sonorae]
MSNPKLTVAIIGGGIGGLSFAVALLKARNDVVIDIYEAGETFSELGAGLNLWPRVLEVLHSFGLEDELYKYAGPPGLYKKMKFMKADQPEGIYWGEAPANMHGIHRADFLKVFVNHTTTGCTSHFSKKLLSYEDAAGRPVTLKFADGTTATCDLLVGADGVKSAVRSNMYSQIADEMEKAGRPSDVVQSMKNCMKPIWAGSIIYRQLIPREVLEKAFPDHVALDNPTFFQGKSKFLITYPISKGRWVNCAAIVARHDQYGSTYEGSWAVRVTNDVLAEEYANWDPAATTLIHLMDSPIRWVMNTVEYLPTYASGRVAILGDAAHAMTTYQAAGAMQAVEVTVTRTFRSRKSLTEGARTASFSRLC